MLRKVDFLNHKANHLLMFFQNYLNNVLRLPSGTVFIESHCPDQNLRKYIKTSNGVDNALKTKFKEFQKSFLDLTASQRSDFLEIFKESNKVEWLFKNPSKAKRISDYPGKTGVKTHALLKHLFSETIGKKKFDIKDHYQKFYDSLTNNWCPFCGMENYKVPERQKEDYDHLLCKKEYPVTAINMENLVAMGEGCNRRYKKDIDILNCLGKPTKPAYPFRENIQPEISLKGSKIHSKDSQCTWVIKVTPRTDKVKAWNSIFKIDQRIKEEFLIKRPNSKQEPEFRNIIYTQIQNYKIERQTSDEIWTWDDVDSRLRSYVVVLKAQYFRSSNMFKAALFEFILDEADNSYQQALLSMINN